MKEFFKINYWIWITTLLITLLISWLLAINKYVNWLYTRSIGGDVATFEFSYVKMFIFIIVNIIISYLISLIILNIFRKRK